MASSIPQSEIEKIEQKITELRAGGLTKQADALQSSLDAMLAGDWRTVQGVIGSSPYFVSSPESEKFLDNMIANQNVEEAYQREIDARDTSLLSAGQQLQQLGLSSSGVLETGGASSGVSGSVASNSKTNTALERYQQKMLLARQVLGMTSQMASAGIYGSALGTAKKAASVLTSAASHSAYKALYDRWDYILANSGQKGEDEPSLSREQIMKELGY